MHKISVIRYISLFLSLFPFVLKAQSGRMETVVQKGHSASVKAVAVSPDGLYIATGSRDRTTKLWELATAREIRTFFGHEHTINALLFSADGKYLATSSADKTVRIWEVASGKQVFVSPEERKYNTDVALSPDGKLVAIGGYNDSVRIFEIRTGKNIKSIAVNSDLGMGYGIYLAFSKDGKWLAIGQDNRTADLYRSSDWSRIHTFKPAEGWCGGCATMLAFSADNRFLYKLSHGGQAEQYDVHSGKMLASFGEAVDEIRAIEASPDGKTLLVAGDKKLVQWDILKGTIKSTINTEEWGELNKAVYNQDASLIVAGFGSNKAMAYEAATGKVTYQYSGILDKKDNGGLEYNPDNFRESYIAKYIRLKNPLLLSKDNRYFITGKSGTNVIKWNASTGQPAHTFDGHSKAVICLDRSPDGKLLLTGDGAGTAVLWDAVSSQKIRTFSGHREPLFEVKISTDGKQIATCSWDATMIVWDIATGEKKSYIDFREYSAYSMSFSPDGLYLLTGRLNKVLELREPDSKEVVRTFIGHTDIVSSIDFGPEKYKMLSASWDGTARIWDIATGMMVQKFSVSRLPLHAAVYTPDGKSIVTGGDDRKIRIFDVATAKLQKTLEGHQAEITTLRVSSDGKMLVSYSVDGVSKCWNLEQGAEFYEHMQVGDKDWMARTRGGYFNATAGARSAINFVKGLEVYQPEQFFEEFYRPDLLPELFNNRGNSKQERQKIEDKLNMNPPPALKLVLVPQEGDREVEVHIRITDNGGGIEELRLMHNGKALAIGQEEIVFPTGKNKSTTFKKTYPLVAGKNTFSVTGLSKGRLESQPVQDVVFSESAANESVCYILSVGIDKYKNNALSLGYARKDAVSFGDSVEKNAQPLYKKVVRLSLYDEQATRTALLDTLQMLSEKILPHDVLIFYYAGHGSMVDEKFYFVTHECPRLYDLASLTKSAVEASLVQEKLKAIKALKQIIIMDACQSGGSVELLALRGAMEEKAIAQLSRSAGIHVLASSGSEQTAKEIAQLGHGLFTYVLLNALSGAADGTPEDGKITIFEIKSYLDDQVPELNRQYSKKIQYPYTFSRGHDFPIVLK